MMMQIRKEVGKISLDSKGNEAMITSCVRQRARGQGTRTNMLLFYLQNDSSNCMVLQINELNTLRSKRIVDYGIFYPQVSDSMLTNIEGTLRTFWKMTINLATTLRILSSLRGIKQLRVVDSCITIKIISSIYLAHSLG